MFSFTEKLVRHYREFKSLSGVSAGYTTGNVPGVENNTGNVPGAGNNTGNVPGTGNNTGNVSGAGNNTDSLSGAGNQTIFGGGDTDLLAPLAEVSTLY